MTKETPLAWIGGIVFLAIITLILRWILKKPEEGRGERKIYSHHGNYTIQYNLSDFYCIVYFFEFVLIVISIISVIFYLIVFPIITLIIIGTIVTIFVIILTKSSEETKNKLRKILRL